MKDLPPPVSVRVREAADVMPERLGQQRAAERQLTSYLYGRQNIHLTMGMGVRADLNTCRFQSRQVGAAEHARGRQHAFLAPVGQRSGE